MAAGNRRGWKIFRGALVSAWASCGLFLPSAMPASAQSAVEDAVIKPPPGTKLLLTASELVYDQDSKKVIAVGGVQIHYGGYKLVAKRVEYDQATGQ